MKIGEEINPSELVTPWTIQLHLPSTVLPGLATQVSNLRQHQPSPQATSQGSRWWAMTAGRSARTETPNGSRISIWKNIFVYLICGLVVLKNRIRLD
jgi:hypothetical protein